MYLPCAGAWQGGRALYPLKVADPCLRSAIAVGLLFFLQLFELLFVLCLVLFGFSLAFFFVLCFVFFGLSLVLFFVLCFASFGLFLVPFLVLFGLFLVLCFVLLKLFLSLVFVGGGAAKSTGLFFSLLVLFFVLLFLLLFVLLGLVPLLPDALILSLPVAPFGGVGVDDGTAKLATSRLVLRVTRPSGAGGRGRDAAERAG